MSRIPEFGFVPTCTFSQCFFRQLVLENTPSYRTAFQNLNLSNNTTNNENNGIIITLSLCSGIVLLSIGVLLFLFVNHIMW